MRRLTRASLWEAVIASIVGSAAFALITWILAERAFDLASGTIVLVGATATWVVVAAALFTRWRARQVRLVPYLSRRAACARIASARTDIWSFQISGGEFTIDLVDVYEAWLRADGSRKLKMLFADPENTGLLESIVKLSGVGRRSTEASALAILRDTIRTSLRRYDELSSRLAGQVEVRVYDCSPPCSIHAVDANPARRRRGGSIFVEHYLPDLPWPERPCQLVTYRHTLFQTYADQSRIWFDEAIPHPPEGSGLQQPVSTG